MSDLIDYLREKIAAESEPCSHATRVETTTYGDGDHRRYLCTAPGCHHEWTEVRK